jgi:hypothetical protein
MSSRHHGSSSRDRAIGRSDLPDYYEILGVPINADAEMLRAAYHRLARQYHPDVAGDDGIARMKEINRAYSILSDPDKRRAYDTARAGILDFRPHTQQPAGAGSSPVGKATLHERGLLYTHGPLRPGPSLDTDLGSITALAFAADGSMLAIASLAPVAALWRPYTDAPDRIRQLPAPPLRDGHPDAIRRLRVTTDGMVAGWGYAQLAVWNASGTLCLAQPLGQPRLATPDTIDVQLAHDHAGCLIALPQGSQALLVPWDVGPRGTDILPLLPQDPARPARPLRCSERPPTERRYWAIRLRALATDAPILLTLSCARVIPDEPEIIILRHWDLAAQSWFKKRHPCVVRELEAGRCAEIGPPYAVSPDANLLACAATPDQVRVYNIAAGIFDQLPAGPLGAFAHLALAADGCTIAVAREGSNSAEGLVEVWSVADRVCRQQLIHPSRVGALTFAPDHRTLAVGLANGTVQLWLPA